MATYQKHVQRLAVMGGLAFAAPLQADYHTVDLVAGHGKPQARLISVIAGDRLVYDGFNQGGKDWFFGDNALYATSRIAPFAKLISTQDSLGDVAAGMRISGAHGALELGYLDGGLHAKAKAWCTAGGVDWYLTHITNAKPGSKPFSLTEIEATKMMGVHAGVVGRATWTNLSGKPQLQLGVKYVF